MRDRNLASEDLLPKFDKQEKQEIFIFGHAHLKFYPTAKPMNIVKILKTLCAA